MIRRATAITLWLTAISAATYGSANTLAAGSFYPRQNLQASLTRLAAAEARHDYAGWLKLAQTQFAQDAIITTKASQGKRIETLPQYLASEQKNLLSVSAAQGTIEHDYVQSFHLLSATGATAVSELTSHSRQTLSGHPTDIDYVVRREYVLQNQNGAWRIHTLVVTPVSLSVNGVRLGLSRPTRRSLPRHS